jgi:hypothetical protein
MDVTFKKNPNRNILYFFFGLSILIHFSISYTYIQNDISFSQVPSESTEKRILMKLQTLTSTEPKQIVQTEKSKDNRKRKMECRF